MKRRKKKELQKCRSPFSLSLSLPLSLSLFLSKPKVTTKTKKKGGCKLRKLFKSVNDPSAGSPTETLLRLSLPLNDQV